MASLDFQKCFDNTCPALGADVLRAWGVPQQVLQPLLAMWAGQRCYLSFGGAYLPAPVADLGCLPQGDAWSPAALSATLTPVVRRIACTSDCHQA
eukprot:4310343-Alexandrium_andersonii.AAC.1